MMSAPSIAKVNNSINNNPGGFPFSAMAHNNNPNHHHHHHPLMQASNFENTMNNSSLANMLEGFNPPPDPVFSNSSTANHSGRLNLMLTG